MTVIDTRKCMYPNCFENNVKSHAISRSISLESIAEDSHLYSFVPRQNSRDTKQPWLKRVSTNKATRHHCFCDTHEEEFKNIDNHEIENTKDVLLQVYRSLCVAFAQERSSMINLHRLNDAKFYRDISAEKAEEFLRGSEYQELIPLLTEPKALEIVQKKMMFLLSEKIDGECVVFENLAIRVKLLSDTIESKEIPYNELQTISFESFDHTIFYYKADFQIPVALNTIQHGRAGSTEVRVYTSVTPYPESTVIISMLPNSLLGDQVLVDKINDYFSSEHKVVKYVESVMSTSDGWFVKESVIKKWQKKRKNSFVRTACS
ncbi:hypothetical protein [Halopseudomonas sabulinigri]|uniref:Uncharacterized protein n=1 Tax=Halopseudomonas sabulinigri TaxID=472181 RepID=A0ABP9ZL83_9GAMM